MKQLRYGKLKLDKIEKITKILSKIDLSTNRKFIKYLNVVKRKSKDVSNLSANKIEIEKSKLDLMKLYYNLGKYISNKNFNENISDFSYDEEYESLNSKINKLKLYIKEIKSKIDENILFYFRFDFDIIIVNFYM